MIFCYIWLAAFQQNLLKKADVTMEFDPFSLLIAETERQQKEEEEGEKGTAKPFHPHPPGGI